MFVQKIASFLFPLEIEKIPIHLEIFNGDRNTNFNDSTNDDNENNNYNSNNSNNSNNFNNDNNCIINDINNHKQLKYSFFVKDNQ